MFVEVLTSALVKRQLDYESYREDDEKEKFEFKFITSFLGVNFVVYFTQKE